MAINVLCKSCEYNFLVDVEHRGKRIRCPSCGDPVVVGNAPSSKAPGSTTGQIRLRASSSQIRLQKQKGGKGRLIALGAFAGVVVVGLAALMMLRGGPPGEQQRAGGDSQAPTEPAVDDTDPAFQVEDKRLVVVSPNPGGGGVPFVSWADLNDRVEPAVVKVSVRMTSGRKQGSGFVVDASGIIATNYHVIGGAEQIDVVFANGDELSVEGYVHLDQERDIALLKVATQSGSRELTPLPLSSRAARKGDEVAALGSPLGLDFTFSQSHVSATRSADSLRDLAGMVGYRGQWVQHTAAISEGSSGGPLVNQSGEVVAMNTTTLAGGQNLNFAVSAADLTNALQQLTSPQQVTPSVAPVLKPRRTAAAGPRRSADSPLNRSGMTVVDDTASARGRRLLRTLSKVSVWTGKLPEDHRGTVGKAVLGAARRQLDAARVKYAAGQAATLAVEMDLTNGTLSLESALVVEDKEAKELRKIWQYQSRIGTVSRSQLTRGQVPSNLERSIKAHFSKLRMALAAARR